MTRNSCIRTTVGAMAELPGPVVADLQLGMTAVTNKVDHVDSPFWVPSAVHSMKRDAGCQRLTRTFELVLVQSNGEGVIACWSYRAEKIQSMPGLPPSSAGLFQQARTIFDVAGAGFSLQ